MQPKGDKELTFSFAKAERLCSRLEIEQLLQQKQSVFSYPFKCYYRFLSTTEDHPLSQMAVSVPKKIEKTAVGRNRIKRWTREAYRLNNKQKIAPALNQESLIIQLLFVCIGKENLSYQRIENSVCQIFALIEAQINKHKTIN